MPATAKKGTARNPKRPRAAKPIGIEMLDVKMIDPAPENRHIDLDLAPLVESIRR